MKARTFITNGILFSFVLAVFGFAGAGCSSTPKIDWNSRVGNYTYDQAVAELGPADKSARLSDGKTVADWIKRSHGGGVSFGLGTGFSSGGVGVGVGQTVSNGSHDRVLRLTFGPDNKLLSWEKPY